MAVVAVVVVVALSTQHLQLESPRALMGMRPCRLVLETILPPQEEEEKEEVKVWFVQSLWKAGEGVLRGNNSIIKSNTNNNNSILHIRHRAHRRHRHHLLRLPCIISTTYIHHHLTINSIASLRPYKALHQPHLQHLQQEHPSHHHHHHHHPHRQQQTKMHHPHPRQNQVLDLPRLCHPTRPHLLTPAPT
jgi:hypothetical protein